MGEVVTFTEVSKKTGETDKGPWTMFLFSNGSGAKFQTFNWALGMKAEALVGRPGKIEFHPEERNGFTNNVLDSIEPFEGSPPSEVTSTVPIQTGSTGNPPPGRNVNEGYAERQTIINRSAALARVGEHVACGIIEWHPETDDLLTVLQLADGYVKYIENGSEAFGQF